MGARSIRDVYVEALYGTKGKRVFVPEISASTFSALMDEFRRLYGLPRVIHVHDIPWSGAEGGQMGKGLVTPGKGPIHSFRVFMVKLGPGAMTQKHGHMNPAIFYVLKGRGYTVHDGKRFDAEAGDAFIVPPRGVVHQHFNADDKEEFVAIVAHAGAVYWLLHQLAQQTLEAGSGGSGTD